jgi:hypothetical protein
MYLARSAAREPFKLADRSTLASSVPASFPALLCSAELRGIRTVGILTLLKAADFVGAVIGFAIAERIAVAIDRIPEADRVIGDFRYFPDGRWPVAVTRA